MPIFFYEHLKEDLKALRDFLSINEDDVVLLIHLIAKSILIKSQRTSEATLEELFIETSRNTWEHTFNVEYILPIIQVRI